MRWPSSTLSCFPSTLPSSTSASPFIFAMKLVRFVFACFPPSEPPFDGLPDWDCDELSLDGDCDELSFAEAVGDAGGCACWTAACVSSCVSVTKNQRKVTTSGRNQTKHVPPPTFLSSLLEAPLGDNTQSVFAQSNQTRRYEKMEEKRGTDARQ